MAKYAYVSQVDNYDLVVQFPGFALKDLEVKYKENKNNHSIHITVKANEEFYKSKDGLRHEIIKKYKDGNYENYNNLGNLEFGSIFNHEFSEKIDVANTKVTMKNGLLRIQAPKLNQLKEFPNQEDLNETKD